MLIYGLQVNVCWLLFYGLYAALLSRETFFKLNRAYLLVSLVAGLLLPLSQSYVTVVQSATAEYMLRPLVVRAYAVGQSLQTAQAWHWREWLLLLYCLGVLFFALRLLMGIMRIVRLYRQHEKTTYAGFTLVEAATLPFSFFRYIFLQRSDYDDTELRQILQHEQAHIRQRHSFDVLLAECLQVLFWCSPLPFLYKKSLQHVHEYLADADVLRQAEPRQYGRLLIKQLQQARALPFTHHFFFSPFKKRILMMTRNPSARLMLAKYALALPLFACLLVAFALPNSPILAKVATPFVASNAPVSVPTTAPTTVPTTVSTPLPTPTAANPIVSLPDAAPMISDTAAPRLIVEQMPEFQGGNVELFKFLSANIKYPKDAREENVQGMVLIDFVIEEDGSVTNVTCKRSVKKILTDTITSIDPTTHKETQNIVKDERECTTITAESIRVVALTSGKWLPGRDEKGKSVRVRYVLPIKFRLE